MPNDETTWLDVALHDLSDEREDESLRRASKAAQKRTERYAAFLDKAQTPEEFLQRLALIETGLRTYANEAAHDYGCSKPELVYEAALTRLAERGAVLNRDPKRIDPNTNIEGTENSGFADVPGKGKQVPQDVWPDSKQHPRETQKIDPTTETYLEHPELKNNNQGLEAIKKPVVQIDAQSPIGPELVGEGGTFGDSHGTTSPVTDPPAGYVTSKWHLI